MAAVQVQLSPATSTVRPAHAVGRSDCCVSWCTQQSDVYILSSPAGHNSCMQAQAVMLAPAVCRHSIQIRHLSPLKCVGWAVEETCLSSLQAERGFGIAHCKSCMPHEYCMSARYPYIHVTHAAIQTSPYKLAPQHQLAYPIMHEQQLQPCFEASLATKTGPASLFQQTRRPMPGAGCAAA